MDPIHIEGVGKVRPLTKEDTVTLSRGVPSETRRLARSVDMTVKQFKALPEETREQVRRASLYFVCPTYFGPAKVKRRHRRNKA